MWLERNVIIRLRQLSLTNVKTAQSVVRRTGGLASFGLVFVITIPQAVDINHNLRTHQIGQKATHIVIALDTVAVGAKQIKHFVRNLFGLTTQVDLSTIPHGILVRSRKDRNPTFDEKLPTFGDLWGNSFSQLLPDSETDPQRLPLLVSGAMASRTKIQHALGILAFRGSQDRVLSYVYFHYYFVPASCHGVTPFTLV
jgi:hypothetical protein